MAVQDAAVNAFLIGVVIVLLVFISIWFVGFARGRQQVATDAQHTAAIAQLGTLDLSHVSRRTWRDVPIEQLHRGDVLTPVSPEHVVDRVQRLSDGTVAVYGLTREIARQPRSE